MLPRWWTDLAFGRQAAAHVIELFQVAIPDPELAAILPVPDINSQAQRPGQVSFQRFGIDILFGRR